MVLRMVERKGSVRGRVVEDRRMRTFQAELRENIEKGSTLITDEFRAYNNLDSTYVREVINHSISYVEGNIHTNSIENF